MNARHALLAATAALSLPALADSGFTLVNGEAGLVVHDAASTRTRADVLRELVVSRTGSPTAPGWRQVHGEAGWEYVGQRSTTTRAAVVAETLRAIINPEPIDGWLAVGGELGAQYVATRAAEATRTRFETRLGLAAPARDSARK